MELKTLDKWMQDYEEAIYNKLMLTKKLVRDWRDACKAQRILKVNGYSSDVNKVEIPEMRNCCCWTIAPTWGREVFNIFGKDITMIYDVIEIDGKNYKDHIYSVGNWSAQQSNKYRNIVQSYNGLKTLLVLNGCAYSEVEWVKTHEEEQIRARAHKEMLNQKKAIEERVKKICGEELTNIEELGGEIFAKGANGKTAHLWAIYAGGYNIQCLHVRVLVKEVK